MIVPSSREGSNERLPLFVAEVCSNHHKDLARCLQFIDRSAQIGCSAVKFQLFKIRELYAAEILARSQVHRLREAWELPVEFLPRLAQRAHQQGIQFSCTPFYLQAVEELSPYVDFYKIASYELLWKELLQACARTRKPVVLSTGMASLEEVETAVDVLTGAGCQELTLLHCVSGYPTPARECNLAAIEKLRNLGPHEVGWSDHTRNPGVIFRAVHRFGAQMIEFHMDLDEQGAEYGMGHCWLPQEMGSVIAAIKDGLWADGQGKKIPSGQEDEEKNWRADPSDGLRPLKSYRAVFKGDPSL